MKTKMYLQLFDDGAGAGSANQSGNHGSNNGNNRDNGQGSSAGTGNQATFSFEQAEEIANARAHRAEQAALRSYFQQQGMTQEQVSQALNDYRQRQQSQQPNVTQLQTDLAAAQAKNAQYENEKVLSGKGVSAQDMDYVLFKVSKLVDDKTDFEKAADKFLKENPRFSENSSGSYRVSTGIQSSGSGGKENSNDFINAAIRRAAGR